MRGVHQRPLVGVVASLEPRPGRVRRQQKQDVVLLLVALAVARFPLRRAGQPGVVGYARDRRVQLRPDSRELPRVLGDASAPAVRDVLSARATR